jgi:hypothetical protein
MRMTCTLVALLAAVACGGRVDDTASGGPGTNMMDAGACPPPAMAGCAGFSSLVACVASQLASGPPANGVELFVRQSDMFAYFRSLAASGDLVIPAHGIDCNLHDLRSTACDWNPLIARLDANDVHYSNGVDEFEAPNGEPMIWTYTSNVVGNEVDDEWLVVDGATDSALYQAVLAQNECPVGP